MDLNPLNIESRYPSYIEKINTILTETKCMEILSKQRSCCNGQNKAIELSKIYSQDVRNIYNPYKVVLYGSYSRNEQTQDSDIDIAVIFNGFSGDWLKASSDLWRMTEKADTIIEPVLLDVQNDPSGFVQEVLRTGIEVQIVKIPFLL